MRERRNLRAFLSLSAVASRHCYTVQGCNPLQDNHSSDFRRRAGTPALAHATVSAVPFMRASSGAKFPLESPLDGGAMETIASQR